MTETRFPPLAPEEWSDAQRKVAASLTSSPRGGVRGPYVPLIYSPELAAHMLHLGDFIRFEGVLPPRLKEVVILAVARHWSVDFMFAVHRENSAELGLERAVVDAIAAGGRPQGLPPEEDAALAATLELLRTGRIGDEAYAAMRRHFDERGLIELVGFVGYYTSLAMILNTARIPPPEGAAPLPPLARGLAGPA
jgi:4-carboxymuconolactone decarboxylase